MGARDGPVLGPDSADSADSALGPLFNFRMERAKRRRRWKETVDHAHLEQPREWELRELTLLANGKVVLFS